MRWGNKTDDDDSHPADISDDCVRVLGTDIFYYGEIDVDNVLEFITKFKKIEKDLLKKAIDLPGYTPTVTIHINSDGGDVFAGLSAMDHISASKLKVITVADGMCASAATFMLMGGSTRMMLPNACVLIHQLSSGFWGKYEELKNELENCDKFMSIITDIYRRHTKIPPRKLDDMMKRDIHLTATECLKFGVIDEVYPGNA